MGESQNETKQAFSKNFLYNSIMSYEETRKSTVILEHLRGMEVRPIKRDERFHWDELIRQHHYLGLHSLIGETIRYIAIYQGQWFALIN
jgi:hypothetical protein